MPARIVTQNFMCHTDSCSFLDDSYLYLLTNSQKQLPQEWIKRLIQEGWF